MNQDQVKEKLLRIEGDIPDFKVTFSGKTSKRVDGLYYPDRKEMIIHNKNHADDNELMYTAIHEFAHHIQFSRTAVPISGKAHTTHFWNTFHKLLYKAEELEIYHNVFQNDGEFKDLTRKIKEQFLSTNGRLMKEFGSLLLEARKLCKKHNTSFEDYLDRVLNLPRSSAKAIIKTHVLNINPAIGFENMKTVSSIRSEETRQKAEEAFVNGMSPDMVKMEFMSKDDPEEKDPAELLQKEKNQIEKRIQALQNKLIEIDKRLESVEKENPAN